jgi:hypothetical protein
MPGRNRREVGRTAVEGETPDVDETPNGSNCLPDSAPDDGAQNAPEVTTELALGLLQRAKPSDVLGILRDPEMALVAMRAFTGFRFNAQGYHNPIVRSRLAQEAVRESKFYDRLAALSPSDDQAPKPTADGSRGEAVAPEHSAGMQKLEDELRREREQRKRDRSEARAAIDELRKANTSIHEQLEAAQKTLADALAERDTQHAALARASHRIERLDRQIAKLKSERNALLKAIPPDAGVPSAPKADKAPRSPLPSNAPQPTPFEAGAYRLLSQENLDAALAVAEAALTEDESNLAALDIAATVYHKIGKRERAIQSARDLALAALDAADLKRATEAFLTLLTIDPMSGLISTVSRPYVTALRSAAPIHLQEIAARFSRFRATNPAVHRRLSRLIEEHVPSEIAKIILVRSAAIGAGDPLPLQVPEQLTPLSVIAAIDSVAVETVAMVRTALEHLRETSPDDYGRSIEAIAETGDESYLRPLLRRSRGPAIVDASNVAWYDDAKGVAERPKLAHILLIRTAVRLRGYFPIFLIADAPLPYTIDERDRFAKMMSRSEVSIVSTGTDADESILRDARRLEAPVITNDYMADWDPDDKIEKIRYVIPSTGPAYLLS